MAYQERTPGEIISQQHSRHDDESSASTKKTMEVSFETAIPEHCRVAILNYLGPEDLVAVSLVSKTLHGDCFRPGTKPRIRPVYEISPLPNGMTSFVEMIQRLENYRKNEHHKSSNYPCLKITNLQLFDTRVTEKSYLFLRGLIAHSKAEKTTSKDEERKSWEVLDLSVSSIVEFSDMFLPLSLCTTFSQIRELDLSNLRFPRMIHFVAFIERLARLEKVTWRGSRNLNLMGWHFASPDDDAGSKPNQLKELVLDDSDFDVKSKHWLKAISDIGTTEKPPAYSLYMMESCCEKGLEGLSVKNARCHHGDQEPVPIPQQALIKFVRKAPETLRWFRSDLTQENKEMLRRERPTILLLS